MAKNKAQRDRLEILGMILEASIEGTKKTRLMQKCNLSHEHLTQNLEELVACDLIKPLDHEDKVVYITTERGRSFLDSFRVLTSLLNDNYAEVFAHYLPQKDKGYQS